MAPTNPMPQRERAPEDFRHVLRFLRSSYDWTLVDLGRGLSMLSMTVLEELDECYLVSTLDIPSLHQAKSTIQALLDGGYGRDRLKLIINRWPKRADVSPDEIQTMLGLPVTAAVPEDYSSLYEAYADSRLASPKSNLGRSVGRLAVSLAGHVEEKPQRRFSILSF